MLPAGTAASWDHTAAIFNSRSELPDARQPGLKGANLKAQCLGRRDRRTGRIGQHLARSKLLLRRSITPEKGFGFLPARPIGNRSARPIGNRIFVLSGTVRVDKPMIKLTDSAPSNGANRIESFGFF